MASRLTPVAYHGAQTPTETFDVGRGQMIFFAESLAYAQSYGPVVTAARLSISRLADLDYNPATRHLAIKNFNACNHRNTEDGWHDYFDPDQDDTWELTESPTFVETMKAAGYDGAVFSEGPGCGRAYAVFDARQVEILYTCETNDRQRGRSLDDLDLSGINAALPDQEADHSIDPALSSSAVVR